MDPLEVPTLYENSGSTLVEAYKFFHKLATRLGVELEDNDPTLETSDSGQQSSLQHLQVAVPIFNAWAMPSFNDSASRKTESLVLRSTKNALGAIADWLGHSAGQILIRETNNFLQSNQTRG